MSYRVRTAGFTGPFDLLLSLVSRQRVAIGSISIAEVAEQYLAEVERMGSLDLDVASDFVLVASTLLDMKAASLVPDEVRIRPVDDFDDELANLSPEEAKEELVRRLIAYKQFRNAASSLASRMDAESLMLPRVAGPDPEFLDLMPDYLEGVSLRSLAVICADVTSRRDSFLLDAEHVAPRRTPLALAVDVDPDAFLWQAVNGLVERRDSRSRELGVFLHAGVKRADFGKRQRRHLPCARRRAVHCVVVHQHQFARLAPLDVELHHRRALARRRRDRGNGVFRERRRVAAVRAQSAHRHLRLGGGRRLHRRIGTDTSGGGNSPDERRQNNAFVRPCFC